MTETRNALAFVGLVDVLALILSALSGILADVDTLDLLLPIVVGWILAGNLTVIALGLIVDAVMGIRSIFAKEETSS